MGCMRGLGGAFHSQLWGDGWEAVLYGVGRGLRVIIWCQEEQVAETGSA